ncbi:MAG: DUF1206 domain-containing protein [Acidimicrobiales bacterium]
MSVQFRQTNRTPSADRHWRDPLARFGLVGKGILHLVIGYSIWRLAAGSGNGEDASSSGAVRWIADQPYGTLTLWILAASLAALALWSGIEAVAGDPVDEDDALHRVGFAGKAVLYAGLAVVCVTTALSGSDAGGGSGDGQSGSDQATDTVFDLPMGRWLVFVIGLGIMALAVHLVMVHAVDARFSQRLRVGEDSLAVRFGRVGYGLRSVAYLLVGYFFAQAGLTYDRGEAQGLSGSLRRVAEESWGTWILYASAVGFFTYGIYCFFESRLRRDA